MIERAEGNAEEVILKTEARLGLKEQEIALLEKIITEKDAEIFFLRQVIEFKDIEEEVEYAIPWPIGNLDDLRMTSPFGIRDRYSIGGRGNGPHLGVDLDVKNHYEEIVSVGNGVVIEHWLPPGSVRTVGEKERHYSGHKVFGGYVVVKHDDGTLAKYGHLSETYIKEGVRVDVGEVIGRMGSTGMATGPHLHFEYWYKNELGELEAVNPLDFLKWTAIVEGGFVVLE